MASQDNTGWVGLAAAGGQAAPSSVNNAYRRWNPNSGEVQIRDDNGNWQSIGNTNSPWQTSAKWKDKMPSTAEMSQVNLMLQRGGGGGGDGSGAQTQSYYGGATGSAAGGVSTMTSWNDIGQRYGLSQADLNAFQKAGWDADSFSAAAAQGRGFNDLLQNPPKSTSKQQDNTKPSGDALSTVWGNLTAAEQASVANQMQGGARSFTIGGKTYGVYGGDAAVRNYLNQAPTAEKVALSQMAKTDPTSEALRTSLGQSYQTSLGQAQNPTAQQFQTYLDLYKKVDPTGFAEHQNESAAQDAYLKQMQQESALGATLDPSTQREVSQAARQAQLARGNVYGTPQLVAEAMQRGSAGEARKQQRTTNLQNALQGYQSYLGSGQGMGDIAMNLYNQQQNRLANAQQGSLSYLGSGQTPYQAGAGYYDRAQQQASNAGQAQYQYNPASLGQNYLSNQQQQYGLDIGSQSQNYYNSLNNAYGGGAAGQQKNRTASALSGAASGAIAGAPLAGSTYGLSVVGGAIAGGLGGYYS